MDNLSLLCYLVNNIPITLKSDQGQTIQFIKLAEPKFLEKHIILKNCRFKLSGQIFIDTIAINPQNLNPSYKILIFDEQNYQQFKKQNLNLTVSLIKITKDQLKLVNKQNLPGACGFLFLPQLNSSKIITERKDKFKKILVQYGQIKLKLKSQKMLPQDLNIKELAKLDIQGLLYSKIFEAMGHKNFSTIFYQLAQSLPYSFILKYKNENLALPTTKILGYWLGKANLFEHIPKNLIPILPIDQLKKEWTSFEQPSLDLKPNLKNINPLGHPVRRLLGMLQLLSNTYKDSLLSSCLSTLRQAQKFNQADWKNKKPIFDLIHSLFKPTNSIAYLDTTFSGADRISVIMVDAILPFFLFWNQNIKNINLNKLLFKIYYTFPREKSLNSKVRNMENRLAKVTINKTVNNSLVYPQGMLQLSRDLCLTFQNNCINCSLKKWLE